MDRRIVTEFGCAVKKGLKELDLGHPGVVFLVLPL